MSWFSSILAWSADLIKYIWAKRAKGYVRISALLVGGGVTIAAGSIVGALVQAAYELGAPNCSSSPYWFAPAVGAGFSGIGLLYFSLCYLWDADRLIPTPPDPSITFQSLNGWTFEELIVSIGRGVNTPISLVGFSSEDLDTLVASNRIEGGNLREVLMKTKLLLPARSGIDFDTIVGDNSFTLRRK